LAAPNPEPGGTVAIATGPKTVLGPASIKSRGGTTSGGGPLVPPLVPPVVLPLVLPEAPAVVAPLPLEPVELPRTIPVPLPLVWAAVADAPLSPEMSFE